MNLTPLLHRLKIVNKQAELVPLRLNWAQRQFVHAVEQRVEANKPVRLIVLKARQLGISTATEAVIFTFAFMWDYTRGLVVAHELDSSQHLLSITNTYWDHYPFAPLYTTKYQSKNELAWRETHSSIKVSTAKNVSSGRSRTLKCLHASEVGFWDNAQDTMLGLRQALPNLPHTLEVVESTANGVGNYFYKQWQAATDGEIDYVPLFFPWHKHPEYRASHIGLDHYDLRQLDDEEKILRRLNVTDDSLAWRRHVIANNCNGDVSTFHQEYPTTPEEAFVTTGRNVFPLPMLRRIYKPMEGVLGDLLRDGNTVSFSPNPNGKLRIFRYPYTRDDWGVYFIAGDPTRTIHGDFACAQVINRRTLEQVAVWRGRIDAGTFADELAKLGIYYNVAPISPESTGAGYMTIGRLQGLNYPKIWQRQRADKTPGHATEDLWGWNTTMTSKHLAIGWLLKLIIEGGSENVHGGLVIHDAATFAELRDYVTLPDGGYGPAAVGGFDDTVMALAICVTCHSMEPPLPAYEGPSVNRGPVEPVWESWDEQMEGLGVR